MNHQNRFCLVAVLVLFVILVVVPTYLSWGEGTRIDLGPFRIIHYKAATTPGIFAGALLLIFFLSPSFRQVTLESVSRYDTLRAGTIRLVERVILVGSFFWLAFLKVSQSRLLMTHVYDHGLFVNVLWNLAHGNGYWCSFKQMTFLGDHFSPFLAALAPPFWFGRPLSWPLVAQTMAMVAFVWVAVLIATRIHPLRPFERLLMMLCLLLNCYFHEIHRFDVHALAFALPLALLTYWCAVERECRILLLLILPVALFTVQEDVPIILAGLGLFLLISRTHWKMGILLLVVCPVAFVVNVEILLPHFTHGQNAYFGRYGSLGGSPGGVAFTLLKQPWRLFVLLTRARIVPLGSVVASFGFLPFVTPAFIAAVPPILQHSLADYWGQYGYHFHYSANVLPAMTLASIVALARFRPQYGRLIPVALLLLALSSFRTGSYLGLEDSTLIRTVNRLASTMIGEGGHVSVQDAIGVPFSAREDAYMFPDVLDAETIVLAPKRRTWPLQPGEYDAKLKNLRSSNLWEERAYGELIVFTARRQGNALPPVHHQK